MFRLEIRTGNAAMQTPHDVGRELIAVGTQLIQQEDDHGTIIDCNGNDVGRFDMTASVYTVIGTYGDGEAVEEDGSPQRFAEEYESATGFEGAEAAALEEHPELDIAAVIEGAVKLADI